jgi:ketosteroid isomerase-like protein
VPEAVPHRRARRFFEVWNAEGVERAAERYWDPEIVWEESPEFPDAGVHHGRAACVRRMRERFEFIGKVQIELVDTWGDEDRMLIEAIIHGRGSASGASFATHEFFVMGIEGGLATTFREFIDRDSALRALAAD